MAACWIELSGFLVVGVNGVLVGVRREELWDSSEVMEGESVE